VNREPDFRELVGDDVEAEERERLERVHELLVAAGPPPELPPSLADPDAEYSEPQPYEFLPRRRAGAMLALAAAIALIAFLGGFVAGHRNGAQFNSLGSAAMHGTKAAPSASATISWEERDASGNWPLKLVARNLPALPRNAHYEMYLTREGKRIASCGSFASGGRTVTVRLNAPYTTGRLGWVVTREVRGSPAQAVVLTT